MSRTTSLLDDDSIVLFILLAFRFLNSVTTRTFFQPDEYYQALEPAWSFAYGNHGAWITWEWTQHLRSAIHPALFGAVYYIVGFIPSTPEYSWLKDGLLLFAPKTVQAVIAALGDFYTWRLSKKVYGDRRISHITLALTLLSPWQRFCSTRTFSNGLESMLTVAALCYWPFDWQAVSTVQKAASDQNHKKQISTPIHIAKQLRKALLLAAIATIIRPTNLLIWIVLSIEVLLRPAHPSASSAPRSKSTATLNTDTFASRVLLLTREGITCGMIVLVLSAAVDRAFYGVWTFPAINFLYFNVVQSLAVFYGNNDWHYYLSQGYPLLLTATLPFAFVGLYRAFTVSQAQRLPASKHSLRPLATICMVLPAALSVLSHKEVRFIYPILGPLHVIAALPVSDFIEPIFSPSASNPSKLTQTRLLRSLLLGFLITTDLLIAGYTTLRHNSGIIALPEYIRQEFATYYALTPSTPSESPTNNQHSQNLTLAILMPCHSIPWRSHFLNPPSASQPGIQAWALTCEPPLHLTSPASKSTYLDEADIFYANPTLWLRKNMSPLPPSHFKHPNPPSNPPGLYTAQTKYLWKSATPPQPHLAPGLDITDLQPYLRTSPNQPPRIDTEDLPIRPWPHYLAFFAQLEPTLTTALRGSGYTECWRTFNSHWHDDWRRTGDVVVWCLFPERAREGGDTGGGGERRDTKWEKDRGKDHGSEDRGSRDEMSVVGEETMTPPQRPGKQTVVRV